MSTKSLLFVFVLLCITILGNAQASTSKKKMASKGASMNEASIFNGAWKSEDGKSFNVMHDGYFNVVGQDSSGKWEDVHAGTYTVNGDNTISFKVLYSFWPDHVGAVNTAEYSGSGDTLKVRNFKKLTDANGNDVTSQVPRPDWMTIIRMK